jgi:hypothetical protein
MATPTRAVAILLVVIGMFSLVVLTISFVAATESAYATGSSNVPNIFSLSNIECALRSNSCNILGE